MDELLARIRSCRLCADHLEPRPVLRVAPSSRVLVIGQAPGSKVHASGRPWDDASGEHLLEWLDVDRASFDDPTRFGILPMAFCYPGKGTSGDKPPPPVCARTWHDPIRQALDRAVLTLLVGSYAQKAYLPGARSQSLTETVRRYDQVDPRFFPLPHPSWRSRIWIRKNPWFGQTVLPELRRRVAWALSAPDLE